MKTEGGQRIQDKRELWSIQDCTEADQDVVGRRLADLHLDGRVPHYAEQLQRPLDHFLSKLKVENPVQRHSRLSKLFLNSGADVLTATAISVHGEYSRHIAQTGLNLFRRVALADYHDGPRRRLGSQGWWAWSQHFRLCDLEASRSRQRHLAVMVSTGKTDIAEAAKVWCCGLDGPYIH